MEAVEAAADRVEGVRGVAKSLQICFDFTKGMCTRGDKCKYTHDLATIVQFNSKEKGALNARSGEGPALGDASCTARKFTMHAHTNASGRRNMFRLSAEPVPAGPAMPLQPRPVKHCTTVSGAGSCRQLRRCSGR